MLRETDQIDKPAARLVGEFARAGIWSSPRVGAWSRALNDGISYEKQKKPEDQRYDALDERRTHFAADSHKENYQKD